MSHAVLIGVLVTQILCSLSHKEMEGCAGQDIQDHNPTPQKHQDVPLGKASVLEHLS